MAEFQRRAWAPHMDLEIRGDGRTVYGLAVPYDTPVHIPTRGGGYDEVFRMGAFMDATDPDATNRVKFLLNHDRMALPLGRAVSLREDPAGLIGEFRVSETTIGNDALESIRQGDLDAFSIGFFPKENRGTEREGFVERIRARLQEVSAVNFPMYQTASIAGVRYADPEEYAAERDQLDGDERDQLTEARDQRDQRARATALLDLDTMIRRIKP